MKAMLLAAGHGLRMRPLTLGVPKPAIPVLGRPIAVEILHRLRRHGVDEAVMNLHHLPETVRRVVGEGHEAGLPEIRYSFEEMLLGTAGGLGKAAPWLRGAGPILVHNCDFLSDIDFGAVIESHLASGKLATLVLAPERPGYPGVQVDGAGNVLSLAGSPVVEPGRVAATHLFTGCQVIDEEVLDRIPLGRPSDLVVDVYRELAAKGELGFWLHDGFWWEFGTPELYLEGSMRLIDLPLARRIEIATHDPVSPSHGGRAALGAGARLHDGTRIEGRAAVGMACLVGEGSVLQDCVIMPESWIGPGSRLERTVIGPGVEIPSRFSCRGALVCNAYPTQTSLGSAIRRVGDLLVYELTAERLPTQ